MKRLKLPKEAFSCSKILTLIQFTLCNNMITEKIDKGRRKLQSEQDQSKEEEAIFIFEMSTTKWNGVQKLIIVVVEANWGCSSC